MANIEPVRIEDGSFRRFKWTNVTSADVCLPAAMPQKLDATLEVQGTNGHTTALFGTVAPPSEGTTNKELHDSMLNAISLTADNVVFILENAAYYTPTVTAGTGGVDIYLFGS